MKKILALMLVLVMMLSFVSCTKKAEFFEENLEDADYLVSVTDDEDDLKDAAKALELLSDIELDGDIKYIVAATKLTDSVEITCFEKSSDAKAFAELMEDDEDDDDAVIERKGKLVIVASSEDAFDDAYGK